MKETFIINNKKVEFELDACDNLLEALRKNGYTEVKNGCAEGECGACMVLVDGVNLNSCQVLAMSVKGKEILTVKGLGELHSPSVIQDAYVESGAVQCGFCTPGLIVSTEALLRKNANPSDEEIRNALDGNLCRCTGYVKIIDAVKLAAERLNN